jgi:hypothetical protein
MVLEFVISLTFSFPQRYLAGFGAVLVEHLKLRNNKFIDNAKS